MSLRRPSTTNTPDELFDVWAPILSHAELLVFLYIVRRTLGFRKHADAISYSQFIAGTSRANGSKLNPGCGVKSRTTLSGALASLEARGIIHAEKSRSHGDADTTVYSLVFEGDDVARNTQPDPPSGGTPAVPDGGTPAVPDPRPEVVQFAQRGGPVCPAEVVQPAYLQQTQTTNTTTNTDQGCGARATAAGRTEKKNAFFATMCEELGWRGLRKEVRAEWSQRIGALFDDCTLAECKRAARWFLDGDHFRTNRQLIGQKLASELALWLQDDMPARKNGAGKVSPRRAARSAEPAPCYPEPVRHAGPPGDVWEACKQSLSQIMTATSYERWFAATHFLARDGPNLRVGVPSEQHATYLAGPLAGVVRRELELLGITAAPAYEVVGARRLEVVHG